jgi:hypothetical protein
MTPKRKPAHMKNYMNIPPTTTYRKLSIRVIVNQGKLILQSDRYVKSSGDAWNEASMNNVDLTNKNNIRSIKLLAEATGFKVTR